MTLCGHERGRGINGKVEGEVEREEAGGGRPSAR